MRLGRIAGMLGVVAIGLFALAGPAGAAITVTPSTNLVNGEMVTVTGTVSTGSSPLNIYECAYPSPGPTMGQPLTQSDCDLTNITSVTPDATGAYSTMFKFTDPLTTSGGQIDCSVPGACELVVDLMTPGDVVAFSMVTGNECDGFFMGTKAQGFVKTTSADPATQVTVGQTITVTLDWSANSTPPIVPSKMTDCVMVNGMVDTTLSQEVKTGPFPTNGLYTSFSYVVPASALGEQICDRGAVGNANVNTLKSNILCYTVAAGAVLPEAHLAVLLPASGLGVAGAGLVFARRRRRRRATTV
jgi:hypothetical protein